MRKTVFGLILGLWPVSAVAEPVVIAALGDSLTQGYGLVEQDGLVAQLQGWLDVKGEEVRLINAGVSGDTTAGGAARIAWTLTPEVDGVIVALGGNDLLRGIDPAVSRGHMATILRTARDAGVEVLVVGMKAPGNYGPDYKAKFDAIYPELAAEFGALYLETLFVGLPGQGRDPARLAPFLQADGLHPNATGVAKIAEALGPEVQALIAQVRDR